MYDEVIKLIAESKTVDAYGDIVITETERTVFVRLASITQSEFYQAQAVGLRPEIKFIMADYLDYNFEGIVEYKAFNENTAQRYSVVRTYRNKNELEIVCKKGVE